MHSSMHDRYRSGVMQVVEWVMAGVRTEWQSAAFQAALASPATFITHYVNLHIDAGGHAEVQMISHCTPAQQLGLLSCLDWRVAETSLLPGGAQISALMSILS